MRRTLPIGEAGHRVSGLVDHGHELGIALDHVVVHLRIQLGDERGFLLLARMFHHELEEAIQHSDVLLPGAGVPPCPVLHEHGVAGGEYAEATLGDDHFTRFRDGVTAAVDQVVQGSQLGRLCQVDLLDDGRIATLGRLPQRARLDDHVATHQGARVDRVGGGHVRPPAHACRRDALAGKPLLEVGRLAGAFRPHDEQPAAGCRGETLPLAVQAHRDHPVQVDIVELVVGVERCQVRVALGAGVDVDAVAGVRIQAQLAEVAGCDLVVSLFHGVGLVQIGELGLLEGEELVVDGDGVEGSVIHRTLQEERRGRPRGERTPRWGCQTAIAIW